jgi:hypothetical protein
VRPHRRSVAAPQRRLDDRGAVLVEFAIVGPLLFLMLIGLLDFSLIIVGNTVGTNGAREGARLGVVNYIDADVTGSFNNRLIAAEVEKRLAGLVRDGMVITVRCVDADEDDPHGLADGVRGPAAGTIPCTAAFVVPGADLLEVSFEWRHIGASPFVANTLHRESAMFVIQGRAVYTAPSSTTTLVAPSSSTTSTSTTSTTLPDETSTTTDPVATTTTTPPSCQITGFTTSRVTRSVTIWKSGSKAGQVKDSPGALGVTVTAPGCEAGVVTIRIPGGPAPFDAGVAMDHVSPGVFWYQIGGSNWSTGSYTVTVRSPANTRTFSLSVFG